MAPETPFQPEPSEESHVHDSSALDADLRDFDRDVGRSLTESYRAEVPADLTDRLFEASRASLQPAGDPRGEPGTYRFPSEERLYPAVWWKHAAAAAVVLIGISLVVRFANTTPSPNIGNLASNGESSGWDSKPFEWLADRRESFIGIEFESELALIQNEIAEAEDLFMLANIEDASTFFADSSFDRELENLDSELSQF